ncbi:MAG: sulfatase-like hydrolase/transferase [Oscillospiraceae bacterium]|nr:sulfatase-like hydrolase/transferase [Oscillospiraceae bacterium]
MRENIVFYFSDQQRFDTVVPEIMPNLCEFSKEGTFFENCYTCQPVCGPARASLQTGVYPTECGCHINGIPLPEDTKTLADYFNENGYDTAYIGKLHLASGRNKGKSIKCEKTAIPKERLCGYKYFRGADVLEFTSHGYDGYIFDENGNKIDFEGYRADRINDFAVEYINNHSGDKPFFMFVSQLEPHHQNDRGRFEGPKGKAEKFKDYPIPKNLSFLKGNYKEMYPDYLAAIESLDENFARLIAALKEKGIYDNTTVIYTSDHGCHFKTRNGEYKRSCHDSSIHIPLVVKGKGFGRGVRDDKLISLVDLPATLLQSADIKVPDYYSGTAIQNGEEQKCVFIQISESQCGRAIRTKDFTYSVSAMKPLSASSKIYFEDYLYDNRSDKCQKNNLIKSKEHSEIKRHMKELLLSEIYRTEGKRPFILPAVRKKVK